MILKRITKTMRPAATRPSNCGVVGRALLLASLALVTPSTVGAQDTAEPIQVLIDVHADPMTQCPPFCDVDLADQTSRYLDWVDILNWILLQAYPFGAKISFLSTGQFMEWVLEPADNLVPAQPINPGPDLVRALYASGGQVGTHSHNKRRLASHDWMDLPLNPTEEQIDAQWSDHVGLVDDVVTAVLGISDPTEVRAINTSCGAGTPADPAGRLSRLADYGFSMHQQGADEEFYSYFKHYAMNPWRPASDALLSEDPAGPVVLAPTCSVLGTDQEHYNILQNNLLPRVQARFLMELLNWLHDVDVEATGRIWTFGWGSHPTDYEVGKPTRDAYPRMLQWLSNHFIGHLVGGHGAARYSSFIETRDLFASWEVAHPGASSFNYPAANTDWSLYPYLIPAYVYLAEGDYVGPRPPVGSVRWHQVDAPASAGGPFGFFVAYTEDDLPAIVDLSSFLGPGPIAAVDPVTGDAVNYPPAAVRVEPTGSLLVPPANVVQLCSGDSDPDYPALGSSCTEGVGECLRSGVVVCRDDMRGIECSAVPGIPLPEICDGLDNDCDGAIDEDPPVETVDVRVNPGELVWSALPTATAYDVEWGSLDVLRDTGGDFAAASRPCLANDLAPTHIVVRPDTGVWYLVRPTNCAGAGSYGTAMRDIGVSASPDACP